MKYIFAFVFILIFIPLSAQNYWATKQAGSNVDETLAVTGDNLGNTYTTGYFSGLASIDGVEKVVNGLTDVFISKTSSTGTNVWVVAVGGPSSDRGLGIAVDGDNNVIVSGFYSGTINFGNGISISSNAGSQDAFVAKYSSAGTILWAKSGGSSGNSDRANAVAVDNSGNVFITGQFSGEANFGSLSLTSLNNTIDAFIVKYDANGNELWARKGSGSSIDRGLSIITDNAGSAYAVGQFSGDFTFDNPHANTIINALFVVKYSASGTEEWFRFAGGTEQSIANSITSDGTNIFITGDFGSSITFLGSGNSTLNSSYSNAVFIASYSSSGSLLWKQSQGSSSPVSSRGISVRNGELGIAGWHECTFESLSEVYGEATFNSMGYKDVFVMRYSSAGVFDFARNFGSPTDEIATGIHIQTDGKEVITGVFRDAIYIPLGNVGVIGLTTNVSSPNQGLTYCGDPNYGKFGKLSSSSGYAEDGFTIKAIDLNRSPLDMYKRFGSGCDLSIPDACISLTSSPISYTCEESIIACPPYNVNAVNFIPTSTEMGFQSNYSWTPSGSSSSVIITQPGQRSVTITSKDGCYTSTASVEVDVYPPPVTPLLSDNVVVNTMSSNPAPIVLCPGEEVDLWCDYEPGYSFYWSGPGIAASGQTNNEIVTISQQGYYYFNVESPDGCLNNVAVLVQYYQLPPEELDPFLKFGVEGDTLFLCSPGAPVTAWDFITDQSVPNQHYTFEWSISPATANISGGSTASMGFPETGWYVITVEIESKENECIEVEQTYTVTDSIYAVLQPTPDADFTLTGPSVTCPGDTITLYTSYSSGIPEYSFDIIENFGDSLYVYGAGSYSGSVTITNEFGCSASKSQTVNISTAPTPSISILSQNGTICPGDSVLLASNSPGTPLWQGPSGSMGNDENLYVHEAGLYFAEVTFYPGCALVTNTVQVSEYATPYLEANDGVLCEGDTLEISIVSSAITNISWQEPLSGSDPVQLVTEAGIYHVQITSCNIVTEISVDVQVNTNTLIIEQPDLTPVCVGDSILIQAVPGYYPVYNWSPSGDTSQLYAHNPGSYQVQAIDQYDCPLVSNSLNVSFEPPPPSPSFQSSPVCEGETQIINVGGNYQINYTDGLNGALIQTESTFTIPEFYGDTTVYVFLHSQYCPGETDSLTLSAKPFPEEPILASDAPVCTGTKLNLVVVNSEPGVVYKWFSPTGTAFSGNDVNHGVGGMEYEGLYHCFADLNGCKSDTANIGISLLETRKVVLPPDTNMCYKPDFLVIPTEEFTTYKWQDGSDAPSFNPTESMQLILIVYDENGCKSSDRMEINIVDCSVNIPNIFTPNGDGRNDTWIGLTGEPIYYRIVVYNRWGRIVFESNSVNNAWDGNNYKSGEPCSDGVYFYILRLDNYEGMPIEETGTITLIRS